MIHPRLQEAFPSHRLIRAESAFQVFSARSTSGERSVIIAPHVAADLDRARHALEAVVHAHRLAPHPRVPRVRRIAAVSDVPFVALECSAIVDGEHVIGWSSSARGSSSRARRCRRRLSED